MPRARYGDTATTRTGLPVIIIPNPQLTLFEAGTTTPLAATIFAGPTGGATLTNPFFGDSDGNFEFYLDAAQDVKIVATGVGSGAITDDWVPVPPPVANLVFDGRTALTSLAGGLAVTRDNASGYAGSYRNLRGGVNTIVVTNGGDGYVTPPTVSLPGGATATATILAGQVVSVTVTAPGSHTSTPPVSFSGGGGTGAAATALLTATGFEVQGVGGDQVFAVTGDIVRVAAGKKLVIGTPTVPATSTVYVEHTTGAHYVVTDISLLATGVAASGSAQDAGAFRAVAQQSNSGGDASIRALEGRAVRLSPAVIAPTWGLELNVLSNVASTSLSHTVGAYIASGAGLSGELPSKVGVLIVGPAGWEDFIHGLHTDGTLRYKVSGLGVVTSGHHLSLTSSSHDLGAAVNYWRNTFTQTLLTLSGAEASPAIVGPTTSSGLWWNGANPAVSVSGTKQGEWSSSGLALPTALAVGTAPASAGALRLALLGAINFLSSGSANLRLIGSDGSNNVLIGQTTGAAATVVAGTSIATMQAGTTGAGLQATTGGAIVGYAGGTLGYFGAAGTTKVTLPAAATDPATTMALANALRTMLIGYGQAA